MSVPSWKVVGLRFQDVLELGARSPSILVPLSFLYPVVAQSDCVVSAYLGGLLAITRNLLVLSLLKMNAINSTFEFYFKHKDT